MSILNRFVFRAMLHNEEVYPDPFMFNPDRFMKDGKIDKSVRDPAHACFGFGRRFVWLVNNPNQCLNCSSQYLSWKIHGFLRCLDCHCIFNLRVRLWEGSWWRWKHHGANPWIHLCTGSVSISNNSPFDNLYPDVLFQHAEAIQVLYKTPIQRGWSSHPFCR